MTVSPCWASSQQTSGGGPQGPQERSGHKAFTSRSTPARPEHHGQPRHRIHSTLDPNTADNTVSTTTSVYGRQ
jgi:hypothetical protein